MQNILSTLGAQCDSIAIGKFDGLHIGHQKLLSHLTPNGAVLIIDMPNGEFLTSLDERARRLPNARVIEFEMIRDIEGESFIALLKQALPNLRRIVVGYDFRFGRDRGCGAEDIGGMFDKEVIVVPQVRYNGIPLHSSAIKDFVRHGDIGVANAMLGWRYRIAGKVVRGQGIASKELFPTINARASGFVLPSNGVYATMVEGMWAVSFLGQRISTDGKYAIESHIIGGDFGAVDFGAESKNLESKLRALGKVDADISIEFCQKIRENRRFENLQDLKAQIALDIQQARQILARESNARI